MPTTGLPYGEERSAGARLEPRTALVDAGKRVCLGVIVAAHGVRGAVRIKSFTAEPRDVAHYGVLEDEAGDRRFRLRVLGQATGVVIARIAGVADRDQAEALRGLRLYLSRAALPPAGEEEYYHADLIGLDAVLVDGAQLGQVRAVHDFGAGDTLDIARPDGQQPVMVPFTRAIVPVVDVAGGRLVVDPPPGLLAPAKEDPLPPARGEARVGRANSAPGSRPSPASGERGKQAERAE